MTRPASGPRTDPRPRSRQLLAAARELMPGGVSSPVRAFTAVGGDPLFMASGRGSSILDVDGNRYLDYVASWGPLILGHAHPAPVAAIMAAVQDGTSFGASTAAEVELARLVVERIPAIEQVRFVNSGTEAAMSAIRLARGATGRPKLIKADGGYHGHADSLLVGAGSGALTFGVPSSAGVTAGSAADTLVVAYNDLDAVQRALEANRGQVAAMIIEPVAANMGVVPPAPGYLNGLRQLTAAHGTLLIFDEVVTGFRLGPGGGQELFAVEPDLTCLGKVLGGGLPIGAYGGRAGLMAQLAPEGPVYQAGTLAGNPVATAAGLATLRALDRGSYGRLEVGGGRLEAALRVGAADAGVPIEVNRVGSMFTAFFTDQPVTDALTARRADPNRYARFFHACLEAGVYLPPSQFEACFLSLAHGDEDLERTASVFHQAFSGLSQ